MDGDKLLLHRKLHSHVQYLSWICAFTNKDIASCIFIMGLFDSEISRGFCIMFVEHVMLSELLGAGGLGMRGAGGAGLCSL